MCHRTSRISAGTLPESSQTIRLEGWGARTPNLARRHVRPAGRLTGGMIMRVTRYSRFLHECGSNPKSSAAAASTGLCSGSEASATSSSDTNGDGASESSLARRILLLGSVS